MQVTHMPIIREKHEANYTVIGNQLINDDLLDWKELGLLIYLLSKPSNWTVCPSHLSKQKKTGVNGIYAILKRLTDVGYITKQRHADGKFDWIVHEYKNPHHDNHEQEKPNHEKPHEGNPDEEKPHEDNDRLISTDTTQSTEPNKILNGSKGASAKPKKPRSKLDFPDYFTTEMQAAWKARKAANTQIALDAWVRTAKQANDSGLCDELTAVMTGLESGWKGLKLEWLQNSMKPQQRNVQVASDESDSSIFDRLLIGNDDDAINGSCRRVN